MNSHSMSAQSLITAPFTPIIIIESTAWEYKTIRGWQALINNLLREALPFLPLGDHIHIKLNAELNIVLMDDKGISHLNETWRHKKGPTNVLSFPVSPELTPPDAPKTLGDIVLAYETIQREGIDQGKPFENHLQHLIIHGFLHLLGYDHENQEEANAMEALEVKMLNALNIPNPYE